MRWSPSAALGLACAVLGACGAAPAAVPTTVFGPMHAVLDDLVAAVPPEAEILSRPVSEGGLMDCESDASKSGYSLPIAAVGFATRAADQRVIDQVDRALTGRGWERVEPTNVDVAGEWNASTLDSVHAVLQQSPMGDGRTLWDLTSVGPPIGEPPCGYGAGTTAPP